MTLVRFDRVCLEFGDTPLLVDTEFGIEAGERVCLIGRNGAGKSTMMRLITGELAPDRGEIQRRPGLRVSQLAQSLPAGSELSVREVVNQGLQQTRTRIARYHRLSQGRLDDADLRELHELQQEIETHGGWNPDQQADVILTELGLPGDQPLGELSGGWRRRVALGRALVSRPDLLLLDEPTNHLDISTIEWLEARVRDYPGAVLFITHDRAFLQRLATRIVELDRGRLMSWPGDYRNFLERKEQWLEEEERREALFDKRLAEEEAWIRQGIKARRTRNQGRVRALQAMREQAAARLKTQGSARVHLQQAERSGRKVIEARHVTHGFGGRPLLQDFSLKVMRGERIGLVGNNGVGKTTLLRILLGELTPDQGTVILGTGLEVAYFDQNRQDLDETQTVWENVGDGREYINIHGKDRHVLGYMKDFLFSPKRARQPVVSLSGGERNRVVLAKLFTRPANLLVLDEPTNDLDVEMLEVLEARLVDFQGTLLVVSHDREFLDNVITSVIAFEADGQVRHYPGGYSDWLRQGRGLAQTDRPEPGHPRAVPAAEQRSRAPRKLSYKLQRELDQLPGRIEALEQEVAVLQAQAADPGFYSQPPETFQPVLERLAEGQQALDALVERWAELEQSNGQE